jgi:hypothetical protein
MEGPASGNVKVAAERVRGYDEVFARRNSFPGDAQAISDYLGRHHIRSLRVLELTSRF